MSTVEIIVHRLRLNSYSCLILEVACYLQNQYFFLCSYTKKELGKLLASIRRRIQESSMACDCLNELIQIHSFSTFSRLA